ncbi:transglycosylase SLT domain-containing protein [Alkalihalobacillus deserti]|uniref:transglycosylase SLT domain-containing protein n=1 Tax=Alkalihalobacillus deserti TaxID=2879466 RepID=UPI001D14FC76|nr:transglycosylase SLT domain-containing protein [Alkalihalobacillus deserti]
MFKKLIVICLFTSSLLFTQQSVFAEEIDESIIEEDELKKSEALVDDSEAEEELVKSAQEEERVGVNPSETELRQMLTEKALEHGIPPEILKAIAEKESQSKQFENGKPKISVIDGGIGIMQITPSRIEENRFDEDRLKYDIECNIEAGIDILLERWNDFSGGIIPRINAMDPMILENWYFALMAYNGLGLDGEGIGYNNPFSRVSTYQGQIYNIIRSNSYVQTNVSQVPFFEIIESRIMKFPSPELNWPDAITYSTQMFDAGNRAMILNELEPDDKDDYAYGNLRSVPDMQSGNPKGIPLYTEVEIISGPYYQDTNRNNHYIQYEVQGDNISGFMTSSNLRHLKEKEFAPWEKEMGAVDQEKQWTIAFNQPLNEETVQARTVYVRDDRGNGVRGTVTYNQEDMTITVKPREELYKTDRAYTLHIDGVESAEGEVLESAIQMDFSIQ